MQTNLNNFDGESIYVGIDSHLKSWKVTLKCDELELKNFTAGITQRVPKVYL